MRIHPLIYNVAALCLSVVYSASINLDVIKIKNANAYDEMAPDEHFSPGADVQTPARDGNRHVVVNVNQYVDAAIGSPNERKDRRKRRYFDTDVS